MNKLDKNTQDLYKVILSLDDLNEAERFFRDLLTTGEIKEFGRRWRTAIMLNEGHSYNKIHQVTKLSSTTIARISRWLRHGCNGYRLALDRSNYSSQNVANRADSNKS